MQDGGQEILEPSETDGKREAAPFEAALQMGLSPPLLTKLTWVEDFSSNSLTTLWVPCSQA